MSLYIVLGSPRSGTSLVSGILHNSDVDMGDVNKNMPAGGWPNDPEKMRGDANPLGYYEDTEFSQRNDAIINGTQIGTYLSPPPIEDLAGYWNKPVLDEIAKRLRDRHEETNGSDWGFKDPRTILVWMHYAPHLTSEMDAKIIATFRNPLHTGQSLRQMGACGTLANAISVAATYQKRLARILSSTPCPVTTLSFEDWWYRPDTNKDKMSTFVGRGLNFDHLEPELWRS